MAVDPRRPGARGSGPARRVTRPAGRATRRTVIGTPGAAARTVDAAAVLLAAETIVRAAATLLLAAPVAWIGLAPRLAAQEPATPEPFREAEASIRRMIVEEGVPSVAVAVARHGEIVWERGFGWADRERRVPATAHTLYSLASISKPITATGLMILVERGEVRLDRPANDYLGRGRITGLAGPATEATVARVLSHTAGLPLHYQFFYDGGGYEPPTMDETISRYAVLVHPPGEVYRYSNLGYGILDHIIARVSGLSYADFMRREVFLPLGMTRTSVHVGPRLEEHAAARYDEDGRPIAFYDFDHRGASAVWSSAYDLVRFGAFHLGDRLEGQRAILSDSARRAMRRIGTPGDRESGYALGWSISEDRGVRRVSHSGGMPGVRTLLSLYPDEGLVVAVLTNGSNGSPVPIAEEVVAAVLPEYARRLARDRARAEGGEAEDDGAAPFGPPPARLLGEWSGWLVTWRDSVEMRLDVRADGDLHVRVGDGLGALLEPVAPEGTWRPEEGRLLGRFAGAIPTPDAGRHLHSVLLDLRLRDGALSGQASAQTTDSPVYYALSSYVELRREGAAPEAEEGSPP